MKYKVYEYDFIKNEKKLKYTEKTKDKAMEKAKKIAEQFCQDERPYWKKISDNTTAWVTGCDFGSIIIEVDDEQTKEYEFDNCKVIKYPNQRPIVYSEDGTYLGDLLEG